MTFKSHRKYVNMLIEQCSMWSSMLTGNVIINIACIKYVFVVLKLAKQML